MGDESNGSNEHVSWLWRASNRESGVSWWGERPAAVRHAAYWAVAVILLSVSILDDGAIGVDGGRDLGAASVVLWFFGVLLIGGVIAVTNVTSVRHSVAV